MDREEIIKALMRCDTMYVDDLDAIRNAIALIRELTEENTRLQTDYNELYESTTEEIKSLRAELRERPPKLIITKVSKGGS